MQVAGFSHKKDMLETLSAAFFILSTEPYAHGGVSGGCTCCLRLWIYRYITSEFISLVRHWNVSLLGYIECPPILVLSGDGQGPSRYGLSEFWVHL